MNALSPVSLPLDVLRTSNLDSGVRQGKALQELEGLFLHLLMKEMRKSVPEGGLFGKSPAQKLFQEMLDEVYAQKMAESGQLGIARLMADQIALQERQREAREAALESGEEFFPLNRRRAPAQLLDLPRVRPDNAFIPLQSPGTDADMNLDSGLPR